MSTFDQHFEFSAGYFPEKGEIDLQLNGICDGKNFAGTFPVSHRDGHLLASLVDPCITHDAIVNASNMQTKDESCDYQVRLSHADSSHFMTLMIMRTDDSYRMGLFLPLTQELKERLQAFLADEPSRPQNTSINDVLPMPLPAKPFPRP